ncbi:MAG: GDP-mannose 4,6-dehydratase [Chloroflexi bacterium]|nr:GDP-mannose 4,6-dehydratase [Chloroflexota bacterium]
MQAELFRLPAAPLNATFWRNRRVLVTGCSGLLGSWLTIALTEHGTTVVGLIRDSVPRNNLHISGYDQRITLVTGALENRPLLERIFAEYEIDVCFHLAAQTIVGVAQRAPAVTFETNVRGTWNVLEAARLSPHVRCLIVASSDKAYGRQPQLPYQEDMPLIGRGPYDVSKSCADLIAQSYGINYELPVFITRCGNLFGGGDLNFNRLIPGTIISALRGERPEIRSDGLFTRDYFYVKDAVLAYLQLAERSDMLNHGEAFNFSYGHPLTVLEMMDAILRAVGRPDLQPIIKNEASREIRHQYLSPLKARNELSWQPRYTLQQGLAETVAWYRSWLKQPLINGQSPGRV